MAEHGAIGLASPPLLVGARVWVLARHHLVAQALAAALGARLDDVRVLRWGAADILGDVVDHDADLVLVLDERSSAEAADAVRDLLSHTPARTIVMTMAPRGDDWGALLAAGAAEVITEPPTIERLAEVLLRVGVGEPVLPPDEREDLSASWQRRLTEEAALLSRLETLSRRELRVLDELASGRRAAEIGVALGVAESTVRTHIRSIRRKLGVDSQLRAALVVHRLRAGASGTRPGLPVPRRAVD